MRMYIAVVSPYLWDQGATGMCRCEVINALAALNLANTPIGEKCDFKTKED